MTRIVILIKLESCENLVCVRPRANFLCESLFVYYSTADFYLLQHVVYNIYLEKKYRGFTNLWLNVLKKCLRS